MLNLKDGLRMIIIPFNPYNNVEAKEIGTKGKNFFLITSGWRSSTIQPSVVYEYHESVAQGISEILEGRAIRAEESCVGC